MTGAPDRLARRIHDRAQLSGEFLLPSGVTSDTYFDKYRFQADPALLWDVAEAIAPLIGDEVDAVAGLELGGVPLATMLSQVTGLPTRFVRRQAKEYGPRRLAEGGEVNGRRLVIVDDLIATGGNVIASCLDLRGWGAEVKRVICVIDAEAGARQRLAEHGLELHALYQMSELAAVTKHHD